MNIFGRLRAWWNSPVGSVFDPDGVLDQLSARRPAPARVAYDSSVAFQSARDEAAAWMACGGPVTMPRQTANFAEYVLHRLARTDDALYALGLSYDEVKVDVCRRAISDAIARADAEGWQR